MGLINDIFGRPRKREEAEAAMYSYFKALTAYQPVFRSYEGGLYEMEITRSAIHAFASACSKLQPETTGAEAQRYRQMLQFHPNKYMDTTKFLYRLATILSVNNTAFIVPIYDQRDMETIIGYWPALSDNCDVIDVNGTAWLRFTFAGNQKSAIEMNRVGILTQMQYKSDFFGDSNAALRQTMNLLHTQAEGIENGIKSAAAIRFLAKLASMIRPEDLKKERLRFVEDNLSTDNQGGVMMFDAKYAEVRQIESKPYVVDADQMKLINESVYNYFGVNQQILQNNWQNSYTWQAFYEGKIEPFAIQTGLVMTNMTFSDRQIAFGNSFAFSSNRLQYASTQEKLDASIQLFDRGVIGQNGVADIFNLPHVEGGDQRFIRGEYVGVNQRIDETVTQQQDPAGTGDDNNADL